MSTPFDPRWVPLLLCGCTAATATDGLDTGQSGTVGSAASGGASVAASAGAGRGGMSAAVSGAAGGVGMTTGAGGAGVSEPGSSGTGGSPTLSSTGGTDAGGAPVSAGGVAPIAGAGGQTAATGGTAGDTSAGGVGGATGTGGAGGTAAAGTTSAPPVTFRNPLNESHGSDPWLVYYDGYYYLAATTWGTTQTMKRGATIAALRDAEPVVIWDDSTGSRCCNNWAPEFYLFDGPSGPRWYYYYTAGDGDSLDTQRSHVLESEGQDPMGPYHHQGTLLDYWAIDGSVLEAGGSRYFMFSAWSGPTQNVYIMAMSSPWQLSGERTLLTMPEYAWEEEGSDSVNEGPTPLYHEGRTFVTYSASQCADPGYKLGLLELTGSNPLDAASWNKRSTPVFQTANGAYGSGHNGFFRSPDGTEDWLVYHATDNANGSCWTDRTTRIQRIDWNPDGTPNFGQPFALDADIVVPSGE